MRCRLMPLDVGEQVASGFVQGRPSSLMGKLHLERVEEVLHRGVVVAAAGSAHGGRRLHAGELFAIGLGGVLDAAIRVTDEPSGRFMPLGGHHQGSRRQLCPHGITHGPADRKDIDRVDLLLMASEC